MSKPPAHFFSLPVRITDCTDATRWNPDDGALPPSKCAERGCPFAPGSSGYCPEHAPPAGSGYRWSLVRLARSWVRERCAIGPGYPFIADDVLAVPWRMYACRFADDPATVTAAPMFAAVQRAGAVRAAGGYRGVQLVQAGTFGQ